MKRIISCVCFLTVLFVFQTFEVSGQVYYFTYQGSLKDANVPANGNYDIRFDIYNVPTGGVSQGGANYIQVPVVDGIFSLEFALGFTEFFAPGLNHWVQLSIRPVGSSAPHTILTPRQRIAYAPYSFSSLLSGDTLKLGGVQASQYVLTADARLTDARTPSAGSANYIQNTTTQQANTNFNIAGSGTVGGTLSAGAVSANSISSPGSISGGSVSAALINSTNGYQIGGVTAFRMGNCNTFAGNQAGLFTGGTCNSFYGQNAGRQSDTGSNNSFFGGGAGYLNAGGNDNSFFGLQAGNNSQGSRNSFFGVNAGLGNLAGNSNTLFGYTAATVGTLTNATAVGANSQVNQSNSLVLGSINGVNGATADTNVGIGTTTPNTNSKLHVNGTIRVTNGAVFISNPNTVIITSPNGACWGITVNNSGGLATFPVNPCP